jgi:hypothetical protein
MIWLNKAQQLNYIQNTSAAFPARVRELIGEYRLWGVHLM